MIDVPSGSIYFWMYSCGLKHIPYDDIVAACRLAGKDIREKDATNYWNGFYKSDLYSGISSVLTFSEPNHVASFFELRYEDYPSHPYLGLPEIENRFVPCNESNKPMIKWSQGCFSQTDARLYPGAHYLGENLRGTKFIVIDCDGDHTDELDLDTIDFLWQYANVTHRLSKPKNIPAYDGYEGYLMYQDTPASFHLTFKVDRLIPTMHFRNSHIDIVGNAKNSLRYFKNKQWNGKQPIDMTPEIWSALKNYIRTREEA